jgi:hypothetical protein
VEHRSLAHEQANNPRGGEHVRRVSDSRGVMAASNVSLTHHPAHKQIRHSLRRQPINTVIHRHQFSREYSPREREDSKDSTSFVHCILTAIIRNTSTNRKYDHHPLNPDRGCGYCGVWHLCEVWSRRRTLRLSSLTTYLGRQQPLEHPLLNRGTGLDEARMYSGRRQQRERRLLDRRAGVDKACRVQAFDGDIKQRGLTRCLTLWLVDV